MGRGDMKLPGDGSTSSKSTRIQASRGSNLLSSKMEHMAELMFPGLGFRKLKCDTGVSHHNIENSL
jgi:hypothetical protein